MPFLRSDDRSRAGVSRRAVLAALPVLALPPLLAAPLAAPLSAARAQDVPAAAPAYQVFTLGNPDAPVQILEFSSFTCGHCAHFHTDTLPLLKERYIDTGKASLTLIDFPLDDVAAAVSLVTRCAPTADLYHRLVSIYFGDQNAWLTRDPLKPILGIARLGGLSQERLEACLNSEALFDEIRRRRTEAETQFTITGTPTFAINGVRHQGSYKAESLLPAVDAALAKAEGR